MSCELKLVDVNTLDNKRVVSVSCELKLVDVNTTNHKSAIGTIGRNRYQNSFQMTCTLGTTDFVT
jgi:hypothetical protein